MLAKLVRELPVSDAGDLVYEPLPRRRFRRAAETPAVFVVFDLLADGDRVLLDVPWAERRRRLEALIGGDRTSMAEWLRTGGRPDGPAARSGGPMDA